MAKPFDMKELEKKINSERHDYSLGLEKLDKKIRKTQFRYIDAVLNRLKKVRRRAITLFLVGLAIAVAAALLSNFFPLYDMQAYILLNSILPVQYNPIVNMLSMLVPAVAVFAFLVWLYNRETRIYFYLAQKSQSKGKKADFLSMLVGPFFLLGTAIVSSILLLTLFSILNCQYFICHFYGNLDKMSSNLLFNLFSLSFYLLFLGVLQLKRYLDLVKLGIRDFYKEIKL